MQLTFLGTGTSTGVPQIGCSCAVCTSSDVRDKRFRASALLSVDNRTNILIDCGPDFRTQILKVGSPALVGLLITHSHYDHIGGVDDLRPYCKGDDFPIWCQKDVADDLKTRNPWSFATNPYPGVPTFNIHEVESFRPFSIEDVKITPLAVNHGKLPILGYRFDSGGKSIVYITDCKTMPKETLNIIKGVDLLVINALRYNDHPTHMTVPESLEIVNKAHPRQTYFTHICHQMGRHADVDLPDEVNLAYDGLIIDVK